MEQNEKLREIVNLYTYYFIIGIVSLIALFFLPFLGSTVGLGLAIPDTTAGWIVWVAVKVIVSIINVLIFHSFMQQAKVNVRNNAKYIEAKDILGKTKRKNYAPRSPEMWSRRQYGRKATIIAITTALATVALTQAILTFDWVSMLTYLFTIVMGLVMGVLQMKQAEIYWTGEFWEYAKQVEREEQEKKRCTPFTEGKHDHDRRETTAESTGAGTTEPAGHSVPTE